MNLNEKTEDFHIRKADKKDVPLILDFIRKLAKFEKLSHEVVASAENLEKYLFGDKKAAEVVIAYYNLPSISLASLPSWPNQEFTWKTCLSWKKRGGKVMGRPYWFTLPAWQWRRGTDDWNGRCLIGMTQP